MAFAVYLWWDNLAGAKLIYGHHVQPFIMKYEADIDERLNELKGILKSTFALNANRLKIWLQATILQLIAGHQPTQNVRPSVDMSSVFCCMILIECIFRDMLFWGRVRIFVSYDCCGKQASILRSHTVQMMPSIVLLLGCR